MRKAGTGHENFTAIDRCMGAYWLKLRDGRLVSGATEPPSSSAALSAKQRYLLYEGAAGSTLIEALNGWVCCQHWLRADDDHVQPDHHQVSNRLETGQVSPVVARSLVAACECVLRARDRDPKSMPRQGAHPALGGSTTG